MGKLTKAQTEALAALDTWRKNFWVPTNRANADGIGTATLRSLREIDLVESDKDSRATFWRITSAGRSALAQVKP